MTQTYAQFSPTAMDPQGLGLDDRQDWLVGPCSQTRDSGPLDRSNFRSMCAIVDDAGLGSEVHRFGHWGPGWFEVLLVAPSDAARACLDQIADRLADYPVLDEDDHSREESEDTDQAWEACYRRDVERAIESACGVDDVDDVPIGDLRGAFDRAVRHVGGEWVAESDGMSCYRFREASHIGPGIEFRSVPEISRATRPDRERNGAVRVVVGFRIRPRDLTDRPVIGIVGSPDPHLTRRRSHHDPNETKLSA